MRILPALVLCAGGASAALFYTAGHALLATGSGMEQIRSVGGTSVAEAYYQSVGQLAQGGALCAFGMAALSLTITFGFLGFDSKK